MPYEKEVRAILGDKPFDAALEAVDHGQIKLAHIKNIAKKLNVKTYGSLQQAMESGGANFTGDRHTFKEVLFNWYQNDPKDVTLERLVEVLRGPDVNLKPIAMKIEGMSR